MFVRRMTICTALFCTFPVLAVTPAAASTISVGAYVPAPVFTVPIEITDAIDLVTWQFDLAFDPTDLQATLVTEGPFTSGNGQFLTLFIPGVIDNTAGLISIVAGAYLDLPPGPSGDGVLAYVEFTQLGSGQSAIRVEDPITSEGSRTPVPEPSTMALLTSGLALAGWRHRHTRRKS
jgi:hypothetical protein